MIIIMLLRVSLFFSMCAILMNKVPLANLVFVLKIGCLYPGAFLKHFIEYALLKGSGGTPSCMGPGEKMA